MWSDEAVQARDLERIRYVAANYEHLQGLRKLPLGIFLLLTIFAALYSVFWTSVDGQIPESYVLGGFALIFAVFVASIVLPHFVSVGYEQRYGTVQRYRSIPRRRKVLYVTMVLAILLGGYLPMLVMGIAMLAAYWPDRRFQKHYVMLGMLAVFVAIAHVASTFAWFATGDWVWITGEAMSGLPRMFVMTVIALYLIVGGVLDHLLLVRTMKTAPEEGDVGAF